MTAKRRTRLVSLESALVWGVLIAGLLLAGPALASHDDSTPIGLRITITGQNASGMVGFDITVVDDDVDVDTNDNFTQILIGRRFYYDTERNRGYPYNAWEPVGYTFPPAIDFGDGQTMPVAKIPLTALDTPSGGGTFRGSFSHAYAAPGNYTITAFVAHVYGVEAAQVTTGNTQTLSSGNTFNMRQLNGSSTDTFEGWSAFGLTNTATVDVVSANPIPTVGGLGLLALGVALAGLGLVVMRRLS